MQSRIIDLRPKLEQRPTQELAAILQTETEKELPNDDLVLLILDILEKRDAGKPIELGPQSQAAWENYQEKAIARAKKRVIPTKWIARAASFLLIGGILAAVMLPQQATAGSFWKILTSWTEDLFEYVNIGEENEPQEYVFQTQIPGLQQVYEAVVEELGITEPVVPMWLPGKPELVELECIETPGKNSVYALLREEESEIVLIFDKMAKDFSPTFYKAEAAVIEFEWRGINHNFVPNVDNWLISWTRQNIKCSITLDCQEGILENIIKSIY